MAIITINGNTLGSSLGSGAFQNIGTEMTRSRSSAENLASALKDLHNKIDIAQVATDLSGSINSVTKSEEREEIKKTNLAVAYDKLDELITSTGVIDSQVAQKIETLKKDFYKKYAYLTPECERSIWEKLWEGICKVSIEIIKWELGITLVELCKEHWEIVKVIAVVLMIVVSVVLLATGVGGILGLAALGCLIGMASSLAGTVAHHIRTGQDITFGEIVNAMFYGGISGAISGALGGAFGAALGIETSVTAITAKETLKGMFVSMASNGIASFYTNTIKYFSGDANTKASVLEYIGLNTAFDIVMAGLSEFLFGASNLNFGNELKDFVSGYLGEAANNFFNDGLNLIRSSPKEIVEYVGKLRTSMLNNMGIPSWNFTENGVSYHLPTGFYQSINVDININIIFGGHKNRNSSSETEINFDQFISGALPNLLSGILKPPIPHIPPQIPLPKMPNPVGNPDFPKIPIPDVDFPSVTDTNTIPPLCGTFHNINYHHMPTISFIDLNSVFESIVKY